MREDNLSGSANLFTGVNVIDINQSINQSIFNLNSHKHFYSVEKKNRIHLNIIYNLHIEDDK